MISRRPWLASPVAVVLVLGVAGFGAACSSSSGGATPTPDGGGTPSDGGPSGGDGAVGTGPGGVVSFFSDGMDYTLVAAFDEVTGTPSGGSSPCGAAVGGCMYCKSVAGEGGTGTGLMITLLSAGTLTFTDGSKTLAAIPWAGEGGAGDYTVSSLTQSTLSWAPGDTLGVSATGGSIPAFTGSIAAPHALAGVSPALSLVKAVTVHTSSAFTINWTPSADDGSMKLVLGNETAGEATIGCTADESAGGITVAASLLGMLGTGGGTASLSKTVSKPVTVTGANVMIQAQAPPATGSITFE